MPRCITFVLLLGLCAPCAVAAAPPPTAVWQASVRDVALRSLPTLLYGTSAATSALHAAIQYMVGTELLILFLMWLTYGYRLRHAKLHISALQHLQASMLFMPAIATTTTLITVEGGGSLLRLTEVK